MILNISASFLFQWEGLVHSPPKSIRKIIRLVTMVRWVNTSISSQLSLCACVCIVITFKTYSLETFEFIILYLFTIVTMLCATSFHKLYVYQILWCTLNLRMLHVSYISIKLGKNKTEIFNLMQEYLNTRCTLLCKSLLFWIFLAVKKLPS